MRLIHLSDIHQQLDWRERTFGSTGWRGALGRFELHALGRMGRFEGAEAQLERLLEDVGAHDPDHVVLSGDLTSLGHDEELGRAKELLQPLIRAGKLTVVPGNHDRYVDASGTGFERHFAEALKSELPELAVDRGYPFVRLLGEDHALIGLDSTGVKGMAHYFTGRIGEPQLAALGRILDHPRLKDRTVLLVLHHAPLSRRGRRDATLLDSDRLLEVIAGRRVIVQHGHSHARFWHRAEGDRPHVFGGGSSTQAGREGYWLIDVDDHREVEGRKFRPGRKPVE